MTNHVHLAIEEGEVPLSRIMHAVQSSYARWFNWRHDRVGHLFQSRFKSFLVDRDEYLIALLRYIHENPVRARIVDRAEAYVWSSDRFFRSGRGPGWLDLDRALSMLAPSRSDAVSRYRRLMGTPVDGSYERLPAIEGVIKGDEAFARRALEKSSKEHRFQSDWSAERIARSVAILHGFQLEDLCRRDRRHAVSTPRIVAAFLGRKQLEIPVAEFARLFRREQSTLVRGVLSLERRIASDAEARQRVASIERAVFENTRLHA